MCIRQAVSHITNLFTGNRPAAINQQAATAVNQKDVIKVEKRPWLTITVGTGKPMSELVSMLKEKGYSIDKGYSENFQNVTPAITFAPTEEQVHFVCITPGEIGLKPGWTFREFYKRAAELGFDLCYSGDIFYICANSTSILPVGAGQSLAMEPFKRHYTNGITVGPSKFSFGNYPSLNGLSLDSNNSQMDEPFENPSYLKWRHIFRVRTIK